MASSPIVPSDSGDAEAYTKAWQALYRLMYEGMSFSGREKNCTFLNTGDGRFVDASAVSGLGTIQDGRSYAETDWDNDGAPDLWLASRNAPALRFMRNTRAGEAHFVALRLEGRSSNRDAVGARVEVTAGGELRSRSLRAGSGYLAQSSKWIHVGLGEVTDVEQVVVRWPGGEAERIDGVDADGFYHIVQGEGRATPWTRPGSGAELEPAPVEAAKATERARLPLAMRVPTPRLTYEDPASGAVRPLIEGAPRPVLVNLWASWCVPCVGELSEFTERAEDLRAAGLDVIALSVDEPDKREAAVAMLERLDWPFASGFATPATIDTLDVLQRQLVFRKREMPVPTSFLINELGQLTFVYKGPVSVEQLLEDADRLGGTPAAVRDLGAPFEGRWRREPAYPLQLLIDLTAGLHERGLTVAASDVLRRARMPSGDPQSPELRLARKELLIAAQMLAVPLMEDGHWEEAGAVAALAAALAPDWSWNRALATCLAQLGRLPEAAEQYQRAMELAPAKAFLKVDLAVTLMQLGRPDDVRRLLEPVVAEKPRNLQARLVLAGALERLGRADDALEHVRIALQQNPDHPEARRMLAALE